MLIRPTHDSLYLASRIDERWETHDLSPGRLQYLAWVYGVGEVEDALRSLHGFPPATMRSPYLYLRKILTG